MAEIVRNADVESAAGSALKNINVEVVFATHFQNKHKLPSVTLSRIKHKVPRLTDVSQAKTSARSG
jgi:hypothetical protein